MKIKTEIARRKIVAYLITLTLIGVGFFSLKPVFAQSGVTIRLVNRTPLSVHLYAGSGMADIGTVPPNTESRLPYNLTSNEPVYPLFDIPLSKTFVLQKQRALDINFYYQVTTKTGEQTIIIDTVPEFQDVNTYIVFSNHGTGGAVNLSAKINTRMMRLDKKEMDVATGETAVFRATQGDTISVASPKNVNFPPVDYQKGWVYRFDFSNNTVTLIDSRSLSEVGKPIHAAVVFRGTSPSQSVHNSIINAFNAALQVNKMNIQIVDENDAEYNRNGYAFVITVSEMITQYNEWQGQNLTRAKIEINFEQKGKALLDAYRETITDYSEELAWSMIENKIHDNTAFFMQVSKYIKGYNL
ncbi:MAG: hypothetical protein LBM77_12155 [Spirochaetaceae bacterium]|jgi:hypothetical protein|nr:hypothetical protein [Spirochaetaceae bacterium]